MTVITAPKTSNKPKEASDIAKTKATEEVNKTKKIKGNNTDPETEAVITEGIALFLAGITFGTSFVMAAATVGRLILLIGMGLVAHLNPVSLYWVVLRLVAYGAGCAIT